MRYLPYPLIKRVSLGEVRMLYGILWAIRDNTPLQYATLVDKVIGPDYPNSQKQHVLFLLNEILDKLSGHNLIEMTQISENSEIPDLLGNNLAMLESVQFSTTRLWSMLEETFNLKLSELMSENYTLNACPIFGKPISEYDQRFSEVFVLMPFVPEMKPIYEDHILKVCAQIPTTCSRGDDFFSSNAIMREVWSAIYHATVCIVDCTGRNPNVFYELGSAHTLGKPTILIAQSIDDVPFDIRHLRTIIYSYTPPGMKKFEDELLKAVGSITGLG